MDTIGDNIKQKLSNKYCCEICDYHTCRKSNIDNHYSSDKHKKRSSCDNGDKIKQILSTNKQISDKLVCEFCNKQYNSRNGLWKHKQKCNISTSDNTNENIIISNQPTDKDLIMMLIKENSELKNMMMEQQSMMMKVIENGTHNTTNNNTNSHNKAFNLQFFLNETCKNAMNITDFVESIQYQLSDFEKLSEIGYVAGISDLIVKSLNKLDVTQRPLHCTDKKRETIYIKDQDKWEKDDDNNSKIRKVIKKVAFKNARLINKFTEKYPEFREYNSKYSTQYHKLIIESFGDSHGNEAEKEDKIIRNITKSIVVEK